MHSVKFRHKNKSSGQKSLKIAQHARMRHTEDPQDMYDLKKALKKRLKLDFFFTLENEKYEFDEKIRFKSQSIFFSHLSIPNINEE